MAKITVNAITQNKARELMQSKKEVCYRHKGQTFCSTIKSVKGSARATLNNGTLVPYSFLTPKDDWKEDYVSPRSQRSDTAKDSNYEKSNALEIKPIPNPKLPQFHSIVNDMSFCMDRMRNTRKECSDLSESLCKTSFNQDKLCVESNAQKLIAQLNTQYDLPKNTIKIEGKRRNSYGGGDVYGFYSVNTSSITVFPYTKVKEEVVSNKALLETVVHEWNHHYDTKKLNLNSIHTSGFYKRTSAIYSQLKNVLD